MLIKYNYIINSVIYIYIQIKRDKCNTLKKNDGTNNISSMFYSFLYIYSHSVTFFEDELFLSDLKLVRKPFLESNL